MQKWEVVNISALIWGLGMSVGEHAVVTTGRGVAVDQL